MLLRYRSSALSVIAVCTALGLAACGGNPVGPSAVPALPQSAAPSNGVVVTGTVVGLGGATVSSLSVSSDTGLVVTVQEDPDVRVPVNDDGSFTLRGLPEGSFTLVFLRDDQEIGTLLFALVLPNQEITIKVDTSSGSVLLLEEKRNGIGHGDIEIQGNVEAVLRDVPTGYPRFLIDGETVEARPGETAVRKGGERLTIEDVTVGDQVHVKGVWLAMEGSVQPVFAHEIKLQDDDDDTGDDDSGEKITICHKGKNTITISISAWPAHEAHGDTKGACQ